MARNQNGFTLLELLIVVIMIGLVTAMALPRLGRMRQVLRLDAAAQQFAGDIRRAQVEAIKRNQSVTVTRTDDSSYTVTFIGSRTISEGPVFDAGSSPSVTLASFGPPVGGPARFTINYSARSKVVAVNAAGLVVVQ